VCCLYLLMRLKSTERDGANEDDLMYAFENREDAGRKLARLLRGRDLNDPLVLAIPRGGVIVGAAVSRELDADLDIVLTAKIRSPDQHDTIIGAISESGYLYLNPDAEDVLLAHEDYLTSERARQCAHIAQCRSAYRRGLEAAPIAGRSVILIDDGVATGSTMLAAVHSIHFQNPGSVIMATPVIAEEALDELRRTMPGGHLVAVTVPRVFVSVAQAYQDFGPVDDETVARVLRAHNDHRMRPADLSLD
jgi:putative phosphoribosyl transferase